MYNKKFLLQKNEMKLLSGGVSEVDSHSFQILLSLFLASLNKCYFLMEKKCPAHRD